MSDVLSNGVAQHEVCLRRLATLHRGESAAVATYEQAIETDGAARPLLTTIRDDHRNALNRIGERIAAIGGVPPDSGGIWESFAKAVEGAARVFGNHAAMSALRLGEKHGIDDYVAAVDDASVDHESHDLCRAAIARQEAHIRTLDRLLETT